MRYLDRLGGGCIGVNGEGGPAVFTVVAATAVAASAAAVASALLKVL